VTSHERTIRVRQAGPKPCGLHKSERLLSRKDFLRVSREASQRVDTGNFLVLMVKNQHDHNRLGITITKKIGNAVTRNRLKRVIREFYRHYKHRLPQGFDVVIIARSGAADLTHEQVRLQLQTLTKRPVH
jgi:ribonuclease P protein component